MAYRLFGGKCGCGVTHYSIVGGTRGELKALRSRLAQERTILHYPNDEQDSIKCICGAVLRVATGGELQVDTESDT